MAKLRQPRPFIVSLALLILPLSSALAEVIGSRVQLGHFGIEGQAHDYSPLFQNGPHARSYPSGSISATAGVGVLSIAGQYASVDNGSYGTADLKLNSYFADTVTIEAPGRAGQSGTFTVSFTFDGSYDANLWWDTRASLVYGFGTDAGDGTIPSMSSASNYGLDNAFSYRGDDTYGYGFGNYMFLGTEQTGTFAFTYGQPFDLWLRLGASLHISESDPGDTRMAVSLVKWSGLSNITAGGTPAADVTVSSVNGANWTQSVTNSLPASTNQTQIAQFVLTPTSIILRGTNGAAHGPYRILSTPDIALPAGAWPAIYTNRFDASGGFDTTNSISPAATQGFFRVQ